MGDITEVLMILGRLQEGVERLSADFSSEKNSAAASRKAIYEKHDQIQSEISSIRQDIEVAAVISAEGRREVAALARRVEQNKEDIQPSLDDWKRIKMMGLGIVGLLAIGGLSVGALLTMGVDAFKAALRSWLGG